jgi:tRNA(fMet)-specific endonuclease VapC
LSGRFLLDTNIISRLARDPTGIVKREILKHGEANVFTSVIVASELEYGVAKNISRKLSERVAGTLSHIPVEPLPVEVAQVYGGIRSSLEVRGETIGSNDLFIAAHAMVEGATLVTANTKEFIRVTGLKIENWLEA